MKLQKQQAFTLMEMVTVIFIIGLLIIVFLPTLSNQRDNASQKADVAFERTLQTQVDLYREDINATDGISWDKMAKDNYLTPTQVEKAKKYKIDNKGNVVLNKTETNTKS